MTVSFERSIGLVPGLGEKIAVARSLVTANVKGAPTECVTCSFQAEDMIVLHMVRSIHPDVPVLFRSRKYGARSSIPD